MGSLQPDSRKIKKPERNSSDSSKDFICGGCPRGYKSYPALYLHIKRKHDGEMPSNTKIPKSTRPKLHISVQPGRPNKPTKDIDNVDETEVVLETAQNELMSFLGEKLCVTSDFAPKVSLVAVEQKILEVFKNYDDKWSTDIVKGCRNFFVEHKESEKKLKNLDYEGEFMKLNPENPLTILIWFMIWLAQLYVRAAFLPDLCVVFAKIWKVLDETQLSVQDLDNKLVWKKVLKDCETVVENLVIFKEKLSFMGEFIQKVCQLIGKSFEEKI